MKYIAGIDNILRKKLGKESSSFTLKPAEKG